MRKIVALSLAGTLVALGLLLVPLIGSLVAPSSGCIFGKVGAQENPCLAQEASLSALGFLATLDAGNLLATIDSQSTQIAALQAGSGATEIPVTPTPVATTVSLPTRTPAVYVDAVIPAGVLDAYQAIYDAGYKVGKLENGLYYLGSATAPVLVEQFSSYSCNHCRDFHHDVVVNLFDLIIGGNVKFVFVPLTYIGAFDSTNESKAALCAGEQNRYWEMHDVMFDWLDRYGEDANDLDRLTAAAVQLGMDADAFQTCFDKPAIQAILDQDRIEAANRGLTSTPTVYVNGEIVSPHTLPEVRDAIEQALASGYSPSRPTVAPSSSSALNPDSFDISKATLYTSPSDAFEMLLPPGWEDISGGSNDQFRFSLGNAGDLPAQLSIFVIEHDDLASLLDIAEGIATAQEAINVYRDNLQPSDYSNIGEVLESSIGQYAGFSLDYTLPPYQGSSGSTEIQLRLADIPESSKTIALVYFSSTSIWDQVTTVVGQMIDSMVFNIENLPVSTPFPTERPIERPPTRMPPP